MIMKKFAAIVKNESGDRWLMLFKHPQQPTIDEFNRFFIENNFEVVDYEDGVDPYTCVHVDSIMEITDEAFRVLK